MINIDLLRRYKLQNPRKYFQKFGNKLPEEVDLKPGIPDPIGPVKVELFEKKEVELDFKEPAVDKPKLGRPKKDA